MIHAGIRRIEKGIAFAVAAMILAGAYYAVMQFRSSNIFGVDGHWHIRIAHEMWERGVIRQLPDLKFTIYNDSFRDHHFLFHVLYMPFARFHDLYFGAKLAAWFYATIAAALFVGLLRTLQVRLSFLWLAAFLTGSAGFTFRMLLARVPSVSLSFLLLGLLFLLTGRHRALALTAFGYIWCYDAWPLLAFVTMTFAVIWSTVDPDRATRAATACAIGIALGIIINPYFPDNLTSYSANVYRNLIQTHEPGVGLGLETEPYTTWYYFTSQIPLALLGLFVLARHALAGPQEGSRSEQLKHQVDLLVVATVAIAFLMLSFRSRRYVEYSVPFGVLALAVWDRMLGPFPRGKRYRAAAAALGLALLAAVVGNTAEVLRQTQMNPKYGCVRDAGRWAAANIPAGDTLFTTDWDDFPHLSLNAPKLRYIVGLDPIYMTRKDPHLYQQWKEIAAGEAAGLLRNEIQRLFAATHIYTDDRHSNFRRRLEAEPGVESVYKGQGCYIYRLE